MSVFKYFKGSDNLEILTYSFNDKEFLYEQLYKMIKADILSGKITAQTRLPSKRKLSSHLAVSGTTIEIAYQQLIDEGYIYSKAKVGYFVEEIQHMNSAPKHNDIMEQVTDDSHLLSFKIEHSHSLQFPHHLFRKYARDAFEEEMNHLMETGHPQGEVKLREAIKYYLYHSRGVNCNSDQIIIGSSTEQLFDLVTHLLEGAHYIVENPGYPLIKRVLNFNKLSFSYVDVDEEGIKVNELTTEGTVVHVTPNHQFPTGSVLSAKRRTELLKWATKGQRYIIEDDYDSEFRYTGRPFKTLQGMDGGERVIYMSTFSKSIFPSIRIAYIVLPEHLIDRYNNLDNRPNITVPKHMQYIVAQFIESGEFEKNINRMRKIYKKKLELTLNALTPYKNEIKISGDYAGMHFVMHHKKSLKKDSIQLTTLADYYEGNNEEYDYQYIIGYGGFDDNEIENVIQKLME